MVFSREEIQRNMGDIVTPLAVEIENGRVVRARSVPSVRQFYALVPTILSLSRPLDQGVSRSR